MAEQIIGEELYQVVGSVEIDGLQLGASFDGLNMAESIAWEHKMLNATLSEIMQRPGFTAADLPLMYRAQMEQQLLVSGADKALFMATKWEGEKCTGLLHCFYQPDMVLREKLLQGWHQFAADLANYTPAPAQAPTATGKAPETLPALHIAITGMVTASNLDDFKAHALAVFNGINRDLVTDDDFADAEKTVKWCSDVESRLAAAKQHALSQTASIDALFRTIDDISAEARTVRLDLDKLVKARKDAIRTEIVTSACKELWKYTNELNASIGRDLLPTLSADFASAIKGKRTLESMHAAIDATLANAKIEASATANRITLNLRTIQGAGHEFLFADLAQLVLKAPDDLTAIVQNRISAHQANESARITADTARIAEQERIKAEAAAPAAPAVPAALEAILTAFKIDAPAITPTSPPTLRLGLICARLGFTMQADFLESIGFAPAATDKAAKLYHEEDFPRICQAIANHALKVAKEF
jgi:predicted phage-related endonuclease